MLAKLERVFAKPFVAALTHSDGITALARNPRRLNSLVAGSADGEIRIWDIPGSRPLRKLLGHAGAVRGISFALNSLLFNIVPTALEIGLVAGMSKEP